MMGKKKKEPTNNECDSDSLVFDTTRIVIPVKIDGDDYELKEASGGAVVAWRNALMKGTKIGPDGVPQSMGNVADSEPLLVALCLFPLGKDHHVKEEVVRTWPNRVQKQLLKKAKEISDLDEEDDTVEGLKEQIANLQKRLAEIEKETAKN